MIIPAQAPELSTTLQQKVESLPAMPSTPVVGSPEDAQTQNPRVAAQWAQPVFNAAATQAGRTPLAPASVIASGVLLQQGLAVPTDTPGGLPGAQPWISMLLDRARQAKDAGWVVPWPEPGSASAEPADAERLSDLSGALLKLYKNLTASDLFAVSHLVQNFWGEEKKGDNQSRIDPQLLARWVAALSPDSEVAQQQVSMLLTGQMLWQGDIFPNVPLVLSREDAWRQPQGEGALEKGAQLDLQAQLPDAVALRVNGAQWADHVTLKVQLPEGAPDVYAQRWPELQLRLAQLAQLHGCRLEVSLERSPKAGFDDFA